MPITRAYIKLLYFSAPNFSRHGLIEELEKGGITTGKIIAKWFAFLIVQCELDIHAKLVHVEVNNFFKITGDEVEMCQFSNHNFLISVMFHYGQPWTDFINKQAGLYGWVSSGKCLQFFLGDIFGRHHHAACILEQEWATQFESSLFVKFQIMLDVLAHTLLFPEVHAHLPFRARSMKDNKTNRTCIGDGHKFLSKLLFQKPYDPVIRNDVMEKGEPAKYPTSHLCASLKKPPCGKTEEDDFDQETHNARDMDARRSTIIWHAEHAPDNRRKQWQANCQQVAQQAGMLGPAPITHAI